MRVKCAQWNLVQFHQYYDFEFGVVEHGVERCVSCSLKQAFGFFERWVQGFFCGQEYGTSEFVFELVFAAWLS